LWDERQQDEESKDKEREKRIEREMREGIMR
jgi:hypothetical protein